MMQTRCETVASADGTPIAVWITGEGPPSSRSTARPEIPNLAGLTLYEGAIMPPGVQLTPPAFIDELERMIATGQREEAMEFFARRAVGLDDAGVAALREHTSWAGRLDALPTVPRELRALEVHGADPVATQVVTAPVHLLVGGATDPMRHGWFETVAGLFADAHVTVLPGQGHTANVAAPELLADALLAFMGHRAAA